MIISKRKIRGVRDIRTHAGKVDNSSEPYRIYMKVSMLEMEKARRAKEKESAMRRVREIDARFREIGREKNKLLKDCVNLNTDKATTRESKDTPRSRVHNVSKGFKIKY